MPMPVMPVMPMMTMAMAMVAIARRGIDPKAHRRRRIIVRVGTIRRGDRNATGQTERGGRGDDEALHGGISSWLLILFPSDTPSTLACRKKM